MVRSLRSLTRERYPAWENVQVTALRHVLVVGGTLDEWAADGAEQWHERLAALGKIADHVGASWVTLHPDDSVGTTAGAERRTLQVGGCLVVADPQADGQQRLLAAMRAVAAGGGALTEAAVADALNDPAQADPDLILVLGPSDRLPRALVWELAYGELVYLEVHWHDLQARHLEEAVNAFAARHRRFGGVDAD
jgi:hypothetical protein